MIRSWIYAMLWIALLTFTTWVSQWLLRDVNDSQWYFKLLQLIPWRKFIFLAVKVIMPPSNSWLWEKGLTRTSEILVIWPTIQYSWTSFGSHKMISYAIWALHIYIHHYSKVSYVVLIFADSLFPPRFLTACFTLLIPFICKAELSSLFSTTIFWNGVCHFSVKELDSEYVNSSFY